jgi:sortase A
MKVLGNIFVAVGLLALGYWAIEFASARLYQAQEARRFVSEPHDEPRRAVRSPATIKQPNPIAGSAVAMLAIPRLGLSTIVVEGAEERELKLGPGHILGTPLPGEGGNVGIAGHRDTFFRPLRLIRKYDAIRVVTHERAYEYRVVSTDIVGPNDIRVLCPTKSETLTLVTCYPFYFVGAPPKRFIVRAECVDCPRIESPEKKR